LVPIAQSHHRPISQKAASTPPNHDSVATSKRLLQQNRPQAVIRGGVVPRMGIQHSL
jgi:hypothetical protein